MPIRRYRGMRLKNRQRLPTRRVNSVAEDEPLEIANDASCRLQVRKL